jgi:hypothetical protein
MKEKRIRSVGYLDARLGSQDYMMWLKLEGKSTACVLASQCWSITIAMVVAVVFWNLLGKKSLVDFWVQIGHFVHLCRL